MNRGHGRMGVREDGESIGCKKVICFVIVFFHLSLIIVLHGSLARDITCQAYVSKGELLRPAAQSHSESSDLGRRAGASARGDLHTFLHPDKGEERDALHRLTVYFFQT